MERENLADPSQDEAAANRTVRDLAAVILLAGGVGPNTLADAVGRSVLDMPVTEARTLLDVWIEQLERLAADIGVARLRVCISVDRNGHAPRVGDPSRHPRLEVEVCRDPADYRGTAGVVRDLTRGYAPSDRLLVAAANQVQREPLSDLVRALAAHDESVSIVPHLGSELAGMFLLRCARLEDVPEVGFVDLKEQAIPSAQDRAPLRVVPRPAGAMLPVRTLDEYIRALRVIQVEPEYRADGAAVENPFAERWQSTFRIVEPGADVAPGTVVQNSVVLAGGRVEAGAALARSVVCARGVVRRGQYAVDRIVTP